MISKTEYKNILNTEVFMNKKNPFIRFYLKYFHENTNAIYLIRKMSITKNGIIRRFYKRKLMIKYGIFIEKETLIGRGLYLTHPHGIFITNATIGKNLTIYQDVTIGRGKAGMVNLIPKIGDNVTIYAGAKIIGKVNIGNNVIVGANAVVVKDVPNNSIVAGNPAKIIRINN